MVKHYETVFIATPVLSEDQMKEAVEKFRNILRKNNAEIVHEEDWGLRKLAYPIEKKSTGFYHLIEYEAEGETIENLEIEFKRDERILRFLTVKMDKYAVEYAEKKRREKSTETQQGSEQKTKEE
ncbi:MAG: 30S ribosomal protein S6 [Bacteroidales bacterium]|jgi:small subunit ribosomal protein S6|nr:30S ribosomal protein S6 [Bacteroidales bacterium]